jgi:hypothetical protein
LRPAEREAERAARAFALLPDMSLADQRSAGRRRCAGRGTATTRTAVYAPNRRPRRQVLPPPRTSSTIAYLSVAHAPSRKARRAVVMPHRSKATARAGRVRAQRGGSLTPLMAPIPGALRSANEPCGADR